MIILIGNEGCSRCEVVKNMLTEKGIEFEYKLLSDFDSKTRQQYLGSAKNKGLIQLPIIIQNNEAVSLSEVIK